MGQLEAHLFYLIFAYVRKEIKLFSLSWLGDQAALRTILLYHITNGIFIGGGLETGVTNLFKTLQGNNLMVKLVSTQ